MIMYITLVFIVMISSGTFTIVMIRQNFDNASRRDLEDYAGGVYEQFADFLCATPEPSAESVWRTLSENFRVVNIMANTQWHLINAATGETIFSNATLDRSLYQRYHNSTVAAALIGDTAFNSGKMSEDINNTMTTWMEFARPVRDSANDIRYVIYVRQDATKIFESLSQTTNLIIISLMLALIMTGILGFLFSATITGPIKTLTMRAKELAAGHLDKEIPVLSNDELGQLTESFNNMATELSTSISVMQGEKNKLEIILYNMTDGVLAYDAAGQVIHSNHICKELLWSPEYGEINGLTFDDLLARLNIDPEDVAIGKNYSTTVKIGDKYLAANFIPYFNQGRAIGSIIVLQDVTKHIKLDNMRKEFVANVSHELRTPLTTIKSYTETLLEGALDDQKIAVDFLNVINNETNRMAALVRDLLELSRLDNSQMNFNFTDVDIVRLLEQNLRSHEITADKQHKHIEYSPTMTSLVMSLDAERINQVLNNIISNALKYSYEGARVKVWIEKTEHNVKISVEDNGMGIPKEDLGRIFERFYRVDKARSRKMGGTGLGLSIAKEIMEAHGGAITAQSELGKGTTMVLRLPC